MKKKFKKEDYIKIYRKMLQIRRFEERAAQLYGMGHIGGFCHLYIGQEAVVVGVNKYHPDTNEKVDILNIDNTKVRNQQIKKLQ